MTRTSLIHFISMKKQIGLTLGAASVAIASSLPALSQVSWIKMADATDGTRVWVQKHNWQGRYRTFGSRYIYRDGRELVALRVADCSDWRWRFTDDGEWRPVLQGTVNDAELEYVCK